MFGPLSPKIPVTRSSNETLLWSARGLAVNPAATFVWTGTHTFSSSVVYNSIQYNYGPSYNYGTWYNSANFYQYGTFWTNTSPKSIPYVNASAHLVYNVGQLSFDYTNYRLGVQTATPEAVGHFKSVAGSTISGLTSLSTNLIQWTPIDAPTSGTVTQIAGHLYAVTGENTSVSGGMTSYISGDIIDYRITQYTSGPTFSVVNKVTQATITSGTGASDGDGVTVAWTADTSGTEMVDGYYIERQVNGGGYNDYYDAGGSTSFYDDGNIWSASPSVSPTYPDFIANGATRNYSGYSKTLTPASTDVWSQTSYDYMFTDDSSGTPYVIQHFWGTSYDVTVLNTDESTYYNATNSVYFTEDTTQPFVAGNPISANTYGYLSDGSTLNRDYDFYNYDGFVYSSTSGTSSTTDPNDSNYYYVDINFASIASSAKVLRQLNGGGYNDSQSSATSPIYDDSITAFSGDATVTPNLIYPTAGKFEGHGTDGSAEPVVTLKSLDGSYSRMEFQDNTGAALSSLWSDVGLTSVQASGLCVPSETASRIAGYDGGKNIISLSTTTYPSLTELSYLKGVTSAIQTQLGGKVTGATNATLTLTGTTLGLNLGNANTWTAPIIIQGLGTTTTEHLTTKDSSGNKKFYVTDEGKAVHISNIGVGYTALTQATANMTLFSADGDTRVRCYGGNVSTSYSEFGHIGTSRSIWVNGNSSGTLELFSNGLTRFIVTSTGKAGVGIGFTTPSAVFHARGTTEQLRLDYDASNYFSTTVSSAGAVTFDAVGASAGFAFSDSVTIADAKDIILNTTTGTKIGTSTGQKLAFHNATPVIQRAGAAQSAAATTSATNITPYGYTTAAQADGIVTLLNEIRATLVEKGIMKGAA